MGQIEQFWCLSDREFSEFFKNGPSFYSSSTQWPSVNIFHKSQFFLGHPVHFENGGWTGTEHYTCIIHDRQTQYVQYTSSQHNTIVSKYNAKVDHQNHFKTKVDSKN